jgi:hypothetical protein
MVIYLVDTQTIIYASKEQDGPIAQWLALLRPYFTDVSEKECLYDWPKMNDPEKGVEKIYLERLFVETKEEG